MLFEVVEADKARFTLLTVEAAEKPGRRRARSYSPRPGGRFPIYWQLGTEPFNHVVETDFVTKCLRGVVSATFLAIKTRDRRVPLPERLKLEQVWRIENSEVSRYLADECHF